MSALTRLTFDQNTNQKLGYLPALDGLRAVAIIAVMLFHLKTKSFFPGGGIGVDLFFVLSGFLITTLLLQEWATGNHISLKRFYQRRFLRLFPAVAIFLATYITINLAFQSQDFTGRQSDDLLLQNVAFISVYGFNWLVALGGDAGRGLSHLWSLSVEEQFYLVWPVVLLVALRVHVSALQIMAVSSLIVVGSAALPFMLDGDWARFYYGTDFRLQSVVVGALLAQFYVAGILRLDITRGLLFRIVLLLAALMLVLVVLFGRNHAGMLFHGGHTLVALCSAVLVLGALYREGNVFAAILANPVLVYIGQRSYALYLWHAAINVWLQAVEPVPHFLLTVTLSLFTAELSYRLVESPALALKARLAPRSEATSKVPIVGEGESKAAA